MRGRIVRKRCVSRKRRSTTKGRRVRVIRGKGDYKTFFRKLGSGLKTFGKGVLKGVGGVEGFLTSGGKPQGFINGYKAGGTFKGALASARAGAKLLGVGDYKLSAKGGSSMKYADNVPQMHSGKTGSMRIRHREFTGQTLNCPLTAQQSVFSAIELFINAANPHMFPWLNVIAKQFQQFRFVGLSLEYRAVSGEGILGSNPPLGQITISSNYDVYRPIITSVTEQRTEQYVNVCKPSQNMMAGIECKKSLLDLPFYRTRSEFDRANFQFGDARFYHQGMITLSTSGVTIPNPLPVNAYPLGEIWVSYDVELSQPTSVPIAGVVGPASIYESTGRSGVYVTWGNANAFGAYSPEYPPPIQRNTLGIVDVYAPSFLPYANPAGVAAQVPVGWQFPFSDIDQYYDLRLRYSGPTLASGAVCSMGGFNTFGSAQFVSNWVDGTIGVISPVGLIASSAGVGGLYDCFVQLKVFVPAATNYDAMVPNGIYFDANSGTQSLVIPSGSLGVGGSGRLDVMWTIQSPDYVPVALPVAYSNIISF